MHVAQLLHPLVRRTDVEVIVPRLPDALCAVLEQVRLRTAAAPALLGQHPPREAELEGLHGGRQRPLLWLADQKMNVFRHYHVSQHHPAVAPPYLLQHREK